MGYIAYLSSAVVGLLWFLQRMLLLRWNSKMFPYIPDSMSTPLQRIVMRSWIRYSCKPLIPYCGPTLLQRVTIVANLNIYYLGMLVYINMTNHGSLVLEKILLYFSLQCISTCKTCHPIAAHPTSASMIWTNLLLLCLKAFNVSALWFLRVFLMTPSYVSIFLMISPLEGYRLSFEQT